jgi:uncharacterized coiled-coil protein SlyX
MRAPAGPACRRVAFLAVLFVWPGLAQAACLWNDPARCEVERLREDLRIIEKRLQTCEMMGAHSDRMFDLLQAQLDSLSARLLAVETRIIVDPPKTKRK